MRKKREIQASADEIEDLVWYERKLLMFANIKDGKGKALDKETHDKVVEMMKEIQERTGYSGVKSDFQWGMLNGKLSALRWVLGDDWDQLDT